uniref:AlNc14C174G8077 protein n=1 Tax=Albugo laibachii Nc14 TaxID=890382 RepID=F0WNR5_9STRA|nr:AlNc14C174G8077 [Albugo laibachii Nc14]|eukprot:CCA22957.1 AlNc14C174G8077 [Albugo laibachii Nc14]
MARESNRSISPYGVIEKQRRTIEPTDDSPHLSLAESLMPYQYRNQVHTQGRQSEREFSTRQVQEDLKVTVESLAEQYQNQAALNARMAEQQQWLMKAHEKALDQERKISHLELEVQQRARTSSLSIWGLLEGTARDDIPGKTNTIREERLNSRVIMASGGDIPRPMVQRNNSK